MSRIAIGICVSPEQVGQIADGYDYIELSVSSALNPLEDDAAFALRRPALQQLPHAVRACNVFVPASLKLVGHDVDWDAVELYAQRAFERVSLLGGELIVFGSGGARRVPEGYEPARAWGQLVRFCTICAHEAAAHDMVLAIEPLNHTETNLINTYEEAVQLARDVDEPQVKVLADIYHFMMDGEPLTDIEDGAEWLAHVHLADTDRRWPGSGAYPLEHLFEILHRIEYTGMASIECRWGDDLRDESARSLAFLRTLAG